MKSRYLFPLLLLLSCSGTMPLSAQPAPNPPTPPAPVPPAPAPLPPKPPTPKPKPVAVLTGPSAVAVGKSVWISTAGTIGNCPRFAVSPSDATFRLVKVVSNDDSTKETLTIHFEPERPATYVFSMAVNLNNDTALTLYTVVASGQGPQPPPTPVDPVVDPKPVDPKPKPSGPFHVTVLDDYTKRTPEAATVLTSAKIRDAAKAAGHKFRMFDGSQTGDNEVLKAFAPWVQKAGGLPCVVVTEQNSTPPGKIVTQFKLPATEDGFIDAIKKAGGQ